MTALLIHEFAPAKLNLYLHIIGRRDDGYHDLDSLVAFASVGDQLRLEPAEVFSFAVEGPQAETLANEPTENNLAVKAAQALAEITRQALDCKMTLVKNLPVASGIGGGSSDAAAALRALARHWGLAPNDARLPETASRLGQDVLACLVVENNYLTPSGITPAPDLPHVDCVLVNPGRALPTPAVYKSCRDSGATFSPPAQLEKPPADLAELVAALKARGNDLFEPACDLMPEIRGVITELEKTDCLLARMSGSGATCFGLYADRAAARRASSALLMANPDWWVVPAHLPYKAARTESFAA
jgi:4-diphosphocytidyl-2-C-methyl-D-erythritol kinase